MMPADRCARHLHLCTPNRDSYGAGSIASGLPPPSGHRAPNLQAGQSEADSCPPQAHMHSSPAMTGLLSCSVGLLSRLKAACRADSSCSLHGSSCASSRAVPGAGSHLGAQHSDNNSSLSVNHGASHWGLAPVLTHATPCSRLRHLPAESGAPLTPHSLAQVQVNESDLIHWQIPDGRQQLSRHPARNSVGSSTLFQRFHARGHATHSKLAARLCTTQSGARATHPIKKGMGAVR